MRQFHPIDALFPRGRQGVLAATVLQPERWWYVSDLARHLRVPPSSIQRELASLTAAGVLVRRRDGNRVYVRPDPACPFLPDLQGLLAKTAGIADVLREILLPFAPRICAFLYGSLARGTERSDSDIDLLVVGNLDLAVLAPALRLAEQRLGRPVNVTLYSADEFARKRREGHHFLGTVLRSQKLFLIGNADDLERPLGAKRVQPHTTSKQELDGLRAVVERDLRDAALPQLSDDRRFATAYNAVLQLSKMAVACAGYRVTSSGHHRTTFEALPLALGPQVTDLAMYFDICRRKRNTVDYELAYVATETEADDLVGKTRAFRDQVEAWIVHNHPDWKGEDVTK